MPEHEIWRLFWAKTDRSRDDNGQLIDPEWTYPLWAHLMDVTNAAYVLWSRFLPRTVKRKLSGGIGMSDGEEEAGRFLSFWIGLHDLGKAIPSFQFIDPEAAYLRPLKQRGLNLPHKAFYMPGERVHHGHASISILCRFLSRRDRGDDGLLEALAAFVGFHHGKLTPAFEWRKNAAVRQGKLGNPEWAMAQLALAEAIEAVWKPIWPEVNVSSEECPDWLLAFAGWATLADWLGSMQQHYPRTPSTNPVQHLERSREGAAAAFDEAGLQCRASLRVPPFQSLFGFPPRDLQSVLAKLPPSSTSEPTLTIVEAPTGEGKTEGALYLAARQQTGKAPGGGLYVAMPTQATGNSLFVRLRDDFLAPIGAGRIGAHEPSEGPVANMRLVHGNDLLHPDLEDMLVSASKLGVLYDEQEQEPTTKARTLDWFLPRKRSLLAPYGVGTVDQAFLGALYARHFFLRLFSLSGKTVIFDEVHAYDTYMNELFMRLLAWLRALDTNVIVLSATLPEAVRVRMMEAWSVRNLDRPGCRAPYPVVWHVVEAACKPYPVRASPDRPPQVARLEWIAPAEQKDNEEEQHPIVLSLRPIVEAAVKAGACVGIICNTVARAQKVFTGLADLDLPTEDYVLLHARFPFDRRSGIERDVVGSREQPGRFGKGRKEGPAVLVATQVAEQSLDLDFDLLITDLAPIDLLLQRAGRLHRHRRETRPPGYESPRLIVLCPEPREGLPDVREASGYGAVYDPVVLWQTWHLLRQRGDSWTLPVDYRILIEGVYGVPDDPPTTLPPAAQERWREAAGKARDERRNAINRAGIRRIPAPGDLINVFEIEQPALAEEDEAAAYPHLQAFTRDPDGPSVEVLCLHRRDGRLFVDPNDPHAVFLDLQESRKLSSTEIRSLLGTSVRLSNRAVVEALEPITPEWEAMTEQNPVLRRYRPIGFEHGVWTRGTTRIRYDVLLGLVLEHLKPERT